MKFSDEQDLLMVAQEQVRNALKHLTPDQRQVIALRFFEGWGHEEVAVALQKPVEAVKVIQYRALVALQKILLPKEA